MVPQAHGGSLRVGNPGNVGGTGRPPSEIRERMRGSLDARLHIAEQIADSPKAQAKDRLAALAFLAKFGLGTKAEITGADGSPLNPVVFRERRERADGSPEPEAEAGQFDFED